MNILIVEDDSIDLRLVRMIVQKLGYRIETARDGLEAVSFYEEHRPNSILMDIQMPRMDGIEATGRIKAFKAERGVAPSFIIAVTAHTVAQDREKALQAGVSEYMHKPIRLDELAARLRLAAKELS